MFIDKWRDTEIVVYICNGILLNYKKNAFESVLKRWMNLEPITQSEVVRKRQIPYINTYIWNLERWYQLSYVQSSKGDRHKEQAFRLSGRRRGWSDLRV